MLLLLQYPNLSYKRYSILAATGVFLKDYSFMRQKLLGLLVPDLCVKMEKGPHKTHCLSGIANFGFFFACNPFKLCGPRFPRGVIMEKRPHKTHCLSSFVHIS